VREAAHVIATCTDEVFELLHLGADGRHVSVVPCGVDVSLFSPGGPAEPVPSGRRRLVVVSRLVERKGIGNVIAALPAVPEAELVVAGGPPGSELAGDAEARRLLALAATLGVGDRVQLRGQVERTLLPALLRSADAVVCVPWYEPFGIVPLEAMACGVPVVASAVGGLVDTVVEDVTGVLVPPRRPDLLGSSLRRLLDDPARGRRLGAAGAHRARALYSWRRVAQSTLDVYRAVVSRSGARDGRETRSPASRSTVWRLS
jgi:glycosyltransferase involved in cell wall biosynthesis